MGKADNQKSCLWLAWFRSCWPGTHQTCSNAYYEHAYLCSGKIPGYDCKLHLQGDQQSEAYKAEQDERDRQVAPNTWCGQKICPVDTQWKRETVFPATQRVIGLGGIMSKERNALRKVQSQCVDIKMKYLY